MRKVFRFAFSNTINFIASWMMTCCMTNPNIQGNLAWIILVHQIIKWRCENRNGKEQWEKQLSRSKTNTGRKSVRSLRHGATDRVFSPYSLHAHGLLMLHHQPLQSGTLQVPIVWLPKGKWQPAIHSSLSFLLWLCDFVILYFTSCLGCGKQTDAFMGNWRCTHWVP